jgi:hypothetical protein
MSTPVIGLWVGARVPPALHRLLEALTVDYELRDATSARRLDAAIWHDDPAEPPVNVPVAAWLSGPEGLTHPVAARAAALLTDREQLRDLDPRVVVLLDREPGVPWARPIGPFVRRRLRRGRELGPAPVAWGSDLGWSWAPELAAAGVAVDGEVTDATIACAAAVIAVGAAVVPALAWGSPTVTDPATAAALGVRHEEHVLVGDDGERRRAQAQRLIADDRLAARLGWAGRLFYERRCTQVDAVRRVATALRLGAGGELGVRGGLEARLAELGVPPDGRIRDRVATMTAGFPGRSLEGGQ